MSRKEKGENRDFPTDPAEAVDMARAAVYYFLARTFAREVDEEYMARLPDFEPFLHAVAQWGGESTRDAVAGLSLEAQRFAAVGPEDRTARLQNLAVEYARLFLGSGDETVHLFASVHLGKDGLMMQQPRDEMRTLLRRLDLSLEEGFKDPEDHVAVQFEVMARLIEAGLPSAPRRRGLPREEAVALSRTLLVSHIASWFPDAASSIRRLAKTDFYAGVAGLAREFVLLDLEYLNVEEA